jgi:hypothetical protein
MLIGGQYVYNVSMITYKITPHAAERIQNRLGGLITAAEVIEKVSKRGLPKGRSYMQIKKMVYTEISDPNVKPDGIARGNQIVAIVENDEIITVMLRKSWENSGEFRKIFQ